MSAPSNQYKWRMIGPNGARRTINSEMWLIGGASSGVKSGLKPGGGLEVPKPELISVGEVDGVRPLVDTLSSFGGGDTVEVGDVVGLKPAGPGAGRGAAEALHWRGTPLLLQALGREMARAAGLEEGTRKGTDPVTIRQRQSVALLVRYLRDWQHAAFDAGDGEPPPPAAVLEIRELKQGMKLWSIDELHGVLIWASIGSAKRRRTPMIITDSAGVIKHFKVL